MRSVFLDTVGLIAIWDENDQWHDEAQVAFDRLLSSRVLPVTTTSVLLECGNAAARRSYRSDLIELRRDLQELNTVIEPTSQDELLAWQQYASGHPGSPGIVDCISFEVMRRLGIQHAFTNDQHFRADGFETLF